MPAAQRPVLYDITRLITRFSRPVPNGIDRVDLIYARHFLSRERGGRGLLLGPVGLRAVETQAASAVVSAVARHWREDGEPDSEASYRRACDWLAGKPTADAREPQTSLVDRLFPVEWRRMIRSAPAIGAGGLVPARPVRELPSGAIYLNVSQFPVWIDRYFRFLDQRPDLRAVFFIHDLLPLTYPELFPPAEAARHRQRMDVVARRAAGVIVSGEETASALRELLVQLGRRSPPRICVAPLPADASFSAIEAAGPTDAPPYFITVGTIEPRKNHLMLLNVWRELRERLGDATPKLLVVGVRGWENENVVDMLERCPALAGNVLETGRLSTPALRRLMTGARAVLMPSLAEGFGLPVVEASAAGVPVLASDIGVFRGYAIPQLRRIDPLDGPAWMAAIGDLATGNLPTNQTFRQSIRGQENSSVWHMNHIEEFLSSI